MYLSIDNSIDGRIAIAFNSANGWQEREYPVTTEGSITLGIEALLRELSGKLTDITGLAIRVGRGRFTATRVAITVGNTLAYVLRIPVVAIETDDLAAIQQLLKEQVAGVYAAAHYSSEPRIGGK